MSTHETARQDHAGVDLGDLERSGDGGEDCERKHCIRDAQRVIRRTSVMPAEHGRGGDHRRAHDVGERAAALAALEVAIGGRGAALAGRDQLAVRAVAHRAAGVAPLEAGVDGKSCRALRLPPAASPRCEPGDTMPGTLTRRPFSTCAAARRSSIRLLVQEPMKTRSIATCCERRGGLELHVVERALDVPAAIAVADARWVGHDAVDRRAILRAGAPAHHGRETARHRTASSRSKCASASVGSARPVGERARPSPRPSAHWRGPRGIGRSCRRGRSCRCGRRPRSTCCRWSAAPSIDMARMAEPAYSTAYPVAPPTPIVLDDREDHVLRRDRRRQRPRRSKCAWSSVSSARRSASRGRAGADCRRRSGSPARRRRHWSRCGNRCR